MTIRALYDLDKIMDYGWCECEDSTGATSMLRYWGRGLYPYQGATWSLWLLSLIRSVPEGCIDTLRCQNPHVDKYL